MKETRAITGGRRDLGLRVLVSAVILVALLLSACRPAQVQSAPFISGDDHVSRASAYLVANEAVLGADAILPLDYLRRRYGANWTKSAIDRFAPMARSPEGRQALYPFLRMIEPDARFDFDPSVPQPPFDLPGLSAAWILIVALHCKDVPLTASFTRSVEELTLGGNRGSSTTARALGWAAEQGCLDDSEVKMLDELQTGKMLDFARRSNVVDIAFVEAVSMLLYRGHRADVQPDWIRRIEEAQSSDGSWNLNGTAEPDRATTEALLALMQYENPDAPPIPWIPPRPA